MTVVNLPLHIERLKDALLVRVGPDIKPRDRERLPALGAATGFGESTIEQVCVGGRVVVLNAGSFQYVSKVASNLRISEGVLTPEMRTFHSRPSTMAECDRFELPTHPVSKPLRRRKSQALACRRVERVS